jgi:hypothetical protein
MAVSNVLQTYGDLSRKDSVLPLVEILTAKENKLLTTLGKTVATDTIHFSMTDTLRTAASAAVQEGDDYTYLERTTPSKLINIVQFVAIPFRVTYAQSWSEKYTGQDELARQTTKAISDWGNAAEFDILRSTLVTGASGTTPKMNGIINAISKSTNTTAQTSGTVFSASILKGLMKANWDNSNGEVATDLFMGSYLKTVFDSFTAGSTKYMMSKEAVVTDFVDVYDSGGFGRLRVHTHRYIQQSADATGRILALRPDKIKLAYFKQPYIHETAEAGPYTQKTVFGALTIEVRNQDSNWFASGYNIG